MVEDKDLDWTIGFDGKAFDTQSAVTYNVQGIPSIWLIDKEGVIRQRDTRGEELIQAVGALVEGKMAAPASGERSGH